MLHLIIMAGGSGTRFWPESRRAKPKQFLTLAGEQSLLQQAAVRCRPWIPAERTHVVTNAAHVAETRVQIPELPAQNILAEPCGRNTAPCIGLAAWQIAQADPEAVVLVTPADHLIRPDAEFQATVERGTRIIAADPQASVLIGIPPAYPATGYGYIERGTPATGPAANSWTVRRFREKPDARTAQEFLDAGTFFWNSGIFVWRAARILELLANYQPDIHAGLGRIATRAASTGWGPAIAEQFGDLKSISIDHGVLEPLVAAAPGNVVVLPASFEWDDVGSWQALPKALGIDASGNTVTGLACPLDTERCVIRTSGDHLVATIGLRDFVVVHTGDATLIAPAGDEAALRKLVAELETRGLGTYL